VRLNKPLLTFPAQKATDHENKQTREVYPEFSSHHYEQMPLS
jgi:hypothetical protein